MHFNSSAFSSELHSVKLSMAVRSIFHTRSLEKDDWVVLGFSLRKENRTLTLTYTQSLRGWFCYSAMQTLADCFIIYAVFTHFIQYMSVLTPVNTLNWHDVQNISKEWIAGQIINLPALYWINCVALESWKTHIADMLHPRRERRGEEEGECLQGIECTLNSIVIMTERINYMMPALKTLLY